MVDLATPELPPISGAVKGSVSRVPTGLGQPMQVIVPSFSVEHSYEIRRWQSRGLTVPALGDEVLVVEDESGIPWVVSWWPAAGDAVLAPAFAAPLTLVRAATTAALATNTAPSALTLEASANGALAAQDGVSLAVGDRLLVKNEATGAHNGAYAVTSLGGAAAKWLLTRISTMNESAEVVPGMLVVAAQGTQGAGVEFHLLTTGAIVLGTTALVFAATTAITAPSFVNTWANVGGGFRKADYRRSPDGKVTVRGIVAHSGSLAANSTTAIFTLPEGFRPGETEIFYDDGAVAAGLVAVRLNVNAAGEVIYQAVATGAVEVLPLAKVSFYAD